MNISDYLSPEAVLPDLQASTAQGALEELVTPLISAYPQLDLLEVIEALSARESMGSTAVGDGIAIPHGKVSGLSLVRMTMGRSLAGIDFRAPDKQPCRIFFVILAPEGGGAGQHLRLLAQLARKAQDPVFRSEVLLAKDRDQLWQTVTGL